MPDPRKYDLDFRPSSYRAPGNALEAILVNIHGEARRRALKRLLQRGATWALDSFLARNQLEYAERAKLAGIRPQLIGGEYLPDDEDDETEIARIMTESITYDVVSVRAREVVGGYLYRIVDEYETDFNLTRESSLVPLTMGELIALIDSARYDGLGGGLTNSIRDYNKEAAYGRLSNGVLEARAYLEGLVDFVTVGSAFYPQLGAYYAEEGREWLAVAIREMDEFARSSSQRACQ